MNKSVAKPFREKVEVGDQGQCIFFTFFCSNVNTSYVLLNLRQT